MNKRLIFGWLLFAYGYHAVTYATGATTPAVTHIHHILINKVSECGSVGYIDYQLVTPYGSIYKSRMYAGVVSIDLDNRTDPNKLIGTYVLYFTGCDWNTCHSFSESILIQNNADVLWELSRGDGIKVTKIDR